MAISVSQLRANFYRILDEVLATGTPVEIERNGKRLRIVATEPPPRSQRLVQRRDVVVGDPTDLAEISWQHWSPAL